MTDTIRGMDFARVYGPDYDTRTPKGGVKTRSVTTDLEVLLEALDAVSARWQAWSGNADNPAVVKSEYRSITGEIAPERLGNLGAYEREYLSLTRTLIRAGEEPRSITIDCKYAHVRASSPTADDDQRHVVDFILKNSRQRFTWARLRYLLPLIALPAVLIGYVGVLATQPMNGYAHVLLLALVVLAIVGVVAWARSIHVRSRHLDGTIRVRAKSRKDTESDRAERHANWWLAAKVAPISIGGTLIAAWLAGLLKLKP